MLPGREKPDDSRMHVLDSLVKVLGWRATLLGDPATKDRWRFLRNHLRPGNFRTLDAGCGSGAFTMYASKIGNHALGLSFDEAQLEKASRRAAILRLGTAHFQRVDLRELDRFVNVLGRFEQIMCLECIEHIPNDRKLVSDLASLLTPAGTLIISTPYKYHKAYYNEALSPSEDGGHIRWGYTHDELRQMLAGEGLTVVAVDSFHGFVAQKLINFRLRSVAILPAVLAWPLIWLLRPLNMLDKPLTTLLKYPYLSIGVVAVKNVTYQPECGDPASSKEPVRMFSRDRASTNLDCASINTQYVSAIVAAAGMNNSVPHA